MQHDGHGGDDVDEVLRWFPDEGADSFSASDERQRAAWKLSIFDDHGQLFRCRRGRSLPLVLLLLLMWTRIRCDSNKVGSVEQINTRSTSCPVSVDREKEKWHKLLGADKKRVSWYAGPELVNNKRAIEPNESSRLMICDPRDEMTTTNLLMGHSRAARNGPVAVQVVVNKAINLQNYFWMHNKVKQFCNFCTFA